MATRLRDPRPRREILDAVARLLDPRPDDDLALKIVRRSKGNPKMRWTKRAEDLYIVSEVLNFEDEWVKSGRGRQYRCAVIARPVAVVLCGGAIDVLPLSPRANWGGIAIANLPRRVGPRNWLRLTQSYRWPRLSRAYL